MKIFSRFTNHSEEFKKGVFFMLISSMLLSLFSLFGKFAVEDSPFFLLVFLRFLIPLILMLPYFLWSSSIKELFYTRNLKLQLLRCLCILVYQYSIFYYLMHSTLLNATVLQNTFPLFLPILEKVFFKHRFNKREILSMLICFSGVLCILQPGRGVLEGLSIVVILAPLSQAGSQVLFAHQARNENPKSTLFYLYFLTSVGTAIIYLCASKWMNAKISFPDYTALIWANVIALGVVSIFNQYFRGKAYEHCKPSTLTPFLYFSLIFSAFLDFIIFHRLPNWISVLGAFLVIIGGLTQVYKKKVA